MLLNQFKHQLRRISKNVEQTIAVLLAQHTWQIIRHDPHACIDQTDIATRAAIADFDPFQHDCFRALFRKIQRRRKAGKSAADNHHIGGQIAFKRCGLRCGWSGLFPKAMRARIVEHERQPFHMMKNRRHLSPKLFHVLAVSKTAIFMQQFIPVRNELSLNSLCCRPAPRSTDRTPVSAGSQACLREPPDNSHSRYASAAQKA